MTSKVHEVVCTTASGVAALVWPPIYVALLLSAIAGLCWLLGHIHMPTLSKAFEFVTFGLAGLVVCGWWLITSIKTYQYVRRKCSPPPTGVKSDG